MLFFSCPDAVSFFSKETFISSDYVYWLFFCVFQEQVQGGEIYFSSSFHGVHFITVGEIWQQDCMVYACPLFGGLDAWKAKPDLGS